MTARLSILLLGILEVSLENIPLNGFEYNKVRALLAYLAVEAGQPHSRESLCHLLWPELAENAARQNLSQALSQLRRVLGDKVSDTPFLLTNPSSVQLNPAASWEVDISLFTALVTSAEAHAHRGWHLCTSCAVKLRQAIALYRGDFLAQFYLSDSAPFEEWALLRRERLRQRVLSALERLASYAEWRGAYEGAVEISRRQVELEPLSDNCQRELMRLLALSGQKTAALAQYEAMRRTLKTELDLLPEPETSALYEKIRRGVPPEALKRYQPPSRRLPAPPTGFIGREADLAAVKEMLADGVRLLTVTGAPGAGKTRLALEAAHQLRFDFDDGACFVELAPLAEAAQVPSAMAQALGVKEQPGRTLQQTLEAYLQSRHILLVLDNFEHLTDAAPFIAGLLTSAPGVKLLVTSRAALRLRAEQQYTLAPMSAGEALTLFYARAQAVKPGFRLMAENNQDTIAALCRQLDNLPLGIELMAVRTRTFSPDDLLRQLERRLEAHTETARDLPERQSSLRNAIAWSYQRLADDERRLFAYLGVFAGGCSAEAVQAVAGAAGAEPGRRVPALLEALVENSLVQTQTVAGETRFTLLETIREYALEQLEELGELNAARRRHAEYFLALAEQSRPELHRGDQKAWLDRLSRELANLRLGLSWSQAQASEINLRLATALVGLWVMRGSLQEGQQWLQKALAVNESAPILLGAQGFLAAGRLSIKQGDNVAAKGFLTRSQQLFLQIEDQEGVNEVLYNLGLATMALAEHATAQTFFEQSLELSRRSNDWYAESAALNGMARLAVRQGNYALSNDLTEQALGLSEAHQDFTNIAGMRLNLGINAYDQGDYETSLKYIESSLVAARKMEVNDLIAACLQHLGYSQIALGNLAVARACLEESISLNQMVYAGPFASPIAALGQIHFKLGEYAAARVCQVQALTLRAAANDHRGVAVSFENMAPLDLRQGQPDRAARLLGAAEAIRETLISPMIPALRSEYGQLVAALRQALGESAFDTAWNEGRSLTEEQAVALALKA